MNKESHLRSIYKAISWRIVASMATFSLAIILGIQTDIAIELGIIDFVIKIFIYYIHERIWTNKKDKK